MKKIAIGMTYTKDTPGTHVYNAGDKTAVVPTIYIKKAAMPDGAPATIMVTIEEVK